MTEALFLHDAYEKSFRTEVTKVDDDKVIYYYSSLSGYCLLESE